MKLTGTCLPARSKRYKVDLSFCLKSPNDKLQVQISAGSSWSQWQISLIPRFSYSRTGWSAKEPFGRGEGSMLSPFPNVISLSRNQTSSIARPLSRHARLIMRDSADDDDRGFSSVCVFYCT
ncbi:hypothetical protein BaRGS_00012762 [Batillaria attramentaria]|uniref:Uncharacterized protein n=1 Tax=Batillaria attramentaria TaxID=370345 RepID=A0ABD0L930_9CAEN